jgi:cell division septal protein FtsQ
MAIFPFRKKSQIPGRGKKSGTSSRISELRSPYVKKNLLPSKFFKRGKRKKTLAMPTIQPKKVSKKARNTLAVIIGLALLIGLIYLVGFSRFFDVKSWEITEDGSKITNDEELNNLMKKQKYKNLVFLDENQLAGQVKAIHPEVKKVTVKKIFPQKIKVEMERYPVVANIINIVQGIQKKFVADTQGFLADENTENPELPYVKIFTNEVFMVHTVAVEPSKLDYILKAVNLYEEKFSMKILNAEYYVRERELHLETEKNFTVWLDMEKDLNAQMDKLKKVLSRLDIYNVPLEYIDLRISGTDNEKIIFKRKK